MAINVNIWHKVAGRDRLESDPLEWQADIIGPEFDHHGLGKTPSEALLLADSRWHAYSENSKEA